MKKMLGLLLIVGMLSLSIIVSAGESWWMPIVDYISIGDKFNCTCSVHNGTHNGQDFPAAKGSAVRATKSGTVIASYNSCTGSHYSGAKESIKCTVGTSCGSKSMGNYVTLKHSDGTSSIYMHLSSVAVSTGTYVSQGQYLGGVGTTGSSTGNHLHFAIKNASGTYVNPLNYINTNNPGDYTEAPRNVSLSVNKSLYAAGETVTFTCAGTNVSGYTIGIDRDGTRIFTGDINAVYETSFTDAGTYSAYVSAWNAVGTVDSARVTFTVYNTVPTNVSVSTNKSNFSAGETITFTCTGTNAIGYTIGITKDGNRIFTGDVNAVYETSFSEPGSYAAYVTAWNSIGTIDSQWITFSVYGAVPTNPWIQIDRYNSAINSEVCFAYHADDAESYELWLFRDGICIGSTLIDASGSYTTKFDTPGYYQAYVSCSNFSGYIDSSRIEFNIYGNVPPDPWIYAEKSTVLVNESITVVYNASTTTYFALGFDRYGERIHSVRREWYETTYTTSFDKPGTYTVYISAYNDYGYADSRKVTFTVHDKEISNVGEVFYGKILNKEYWKPIKNDNSVVTMNAERGLADELWKFIRQEDGSYEIASCLDGKSLIAEKNENNTVMQVWVGDATETNRKQWFIYEKNGGLILKPKCSEYVLDLENGTDSNGNRVFLRAEGNGVNQVFSVYRGDDVQLSAPTLEISGEDYGQIDIRWNTVHSSAKYKIRVFSTDNADTPIYVDDVDAMQTSYELKLPRGKYTATVTAYNHFEGMESNRITFDIVIPIFVEVSKKGTKVSFQYVLNLKNAEGAMVALGAFDETDHLLAVQKATYDTNITFDMEHQEHIHCVKLFVWKDMLPVCDAEVMPKIAWLEAGE